MPVERQFGSAVVGKTAAQIYIEVRRGGAVEDRARCQALPDPNDRGRAQLRPGHVGRRVQPILEKTWKAGATVQESGWAKGQKEVRIIDTLELVLTQHRLVVFPTRSQPVGSVHLSTDIGSPLAPDGFESVVVLSVVLNGGAPSGALSVLRRSKSGHSNFSSTFGSRLGRSSGTAAGTNLQPAPRGAR
jgi:hypothetical protein